MGNAAIFSIAGLQDSLKENNDENSGVYCSYIQCGQRYRDRCGILSALLLNKGIDITKTPNPNDDNQLQSILKQIAKSKLVIFCVSKFTSGDSIQCIEIAAALHLNKIFIVVALDDSPEVKNFQKLADEKKPVAWLAMKNIEDIRETAEKLHEGPLSAQEFVASPERDAKPDHVFTNGDKFWGTVVDGKKVGYARCVYANPAGREYIGSFEDDCRHGGSIVRYPNGNIYSGDYVKEKWEGYGMIIYKDGDVYEGQYKKGVRCGLGKMFLNEGVDSYTGEFQNDAFNGKGVYKWKDGAVYEGDFVDGLSHGEGVMKEADGSISYSGRWEGGEEAD